MAVLASCGGNSSDDKIDSVRMADSLEKEALKRDSLKNDSVANAYAPPSKPSDPTQLEKDIKAEKVKVYFEGFGTEPFWTIYITKYELLLVNEGEDTRESFLLVNQFDAKLEKQTITYVTASGKTASVTITREEASPGMGPDIYPYSIYRGPTLEGAGDTLYIKDNSKYEREVS